MSTASRVSIRCASGHHEFSVVVARHYLETGYRCTKLPGWVVVGDYGNLQITRVYYMAVKWSPDVIAVKRQLARCMTAFHDTLARPNKAVLDCS